MRCFTGLRRVAEDCDGAAPRRERAPLASRTDLATLKRWLRRWVAVRHREAAERTVLTAIAGGASPAALADLLLRGRDRPRLRGWRTLARLHQQGVRVSRRHRLGACGRCAAERRRPDGAGPRRRGIDRLAPAGRPDRPVSTRPRSSCPASSPPAALPAAGRIMRRWPRRLLADDPTAIIDALKAAARAGASPADLGRRSPMRRRSGWRASAPPTSMPIGRPRITSSPMPTRCIRRSSGSAAARPTRTTGRGRARPAARRHGAPSRPLPERAAGGAARRGRRPARRRCRPRSRTSAPRCSTPSIASSRSTLRRASSPATSSSVTRPRR